MQWLSPLVEGSYLYSFPYFLKSFLTNVGIASNRIKLFLILPGRPERTHFFPPLTSSLYKEALYHFLLLCVSKKMSKASLDSQQEPKNNPSNWLMFINQYDLKRCAVIISDNFHSTHIKRSFGSWPYSSLQFVIRHAYHFSL
jgi:hypothetical protein